MGSKKVKAPTPRDYKGEMLDALSAQQGIQSKLLELETRYAPEWAKVQRGAAQAQADQFYNFYEQNLPRQAQLASQYTAQFSPVFAQMGQGARTAYGQSLDPSVRGILSTLGTQATSELGLGGALSSQETRLGQQAARAAFASRGMTSGNQAVMAEVLNNYNLSRQREAERRKFAADVYGMGQQELGNAMNLYGSPLLGQMNTLNPTSMYDMGLKMYGASGPQMFQPESQYNAALLTANRKEAMDAQIANAQSRSGLMSGIMGAVGTIGGAMLGGPMGAALGKTLLGGTTSSMGSSVGSTPSFGASFMNKNFSNDYTMGGTYGGNYSD